jgi:hypothetical protein
MIILHVIKKCIINKLCNTKIHHHRIQKHDIGPFSESAQFDSHVESFICKDILAFISNIILNP